MAPFSQLWPGIPQGQRKQTQGVEAFIRSSIGHTLHQRRDLFIPTPFSESPIRLNEDLGLPFAEDPSVFTLQHSILHRCSSPKHQSAPVTQTASRLIQSVSRRKPTHPTLPFWLFQLLILSEPSESPLESLSSSTPHHTPHRTAPLLLHSSFSFLSPACASRSCYPPFACASQSILLSIIPHPHPAFTPYLINH